MRISDWSSDMCSSDLDDRRLEKWSLRNRPRRLDLRGTDLDPLSAQLTLAETTARLKRGLKRLKQLAHDLEHPRTSARAGRSEESRVGKEGGSTCRSRWSPEH